VTWANQNAQIDRSVKRVSTQESKSATAIYAEHNQGLTDEVAKRFG
jgi:hypothetical protein